MAAQPGGERKHLKGAAKETSYGSQESSLSWCLAQLTKSGSVERSSTGLTGADNKPLNGRETSKEVDKRLKAGQWRALVAIRTQHIKGGRSRIVQYLAKGGLPPLLDILRRPESSRKILDLTLSILANCCTEKETRAEVRDSGLKKRQVKSHVDLRSRLLLQLQHLADALMQSNTHPIAVYCLYI